MVRRPTSLVLAMMLLVSVVAPTSLVSAGQAGSVSTPEDAAIFYSKLEALGSFSELYQYMHPDAQRIVPEPAVVGWYSNEFAPNGPGVISVTGVQMMPWTWEVTGTTYPNTAVVSFRQPFANGTVVEDVVRLVEDDGEWRWFFGRSRTFVDEQVGKYGSVTTPSGDQCAGAAEWWAETFPRLSPIENFLYSLESIGTNYGPTPEMIENYAVVFGELSYEQSMSSPPPAAELLQQDLLSLFGAYEVAALNFGPVMRENLNPLAEAGAVSAGMRALDQAGSLSLTVGTNIETFLDTCQPIVVFALGRQGIQTPVLPGERRGGVNLVQCSMFPTQAEAQRFFEAAKPGDPHRLDPDNDKQACR